MSIFRCRRLSAIADRASRDDAESALIYVKDSTIAPHYAVSNIFAIMFPIQAT
jgi:hypothetical protein